MEEERESEREREREREKERKRKRGRWKNDEDEKRERETQNSLLKDKYINVWNFAGLKSGVFHSKTRSAKLKNQVNLGTLTFTNHLTCSLVSTSSPCSFCFLKILFYSTLLSNLTLLTTLLFLLTLTSPLHLPATLTIRPCPHSLYLLLFIFQYFMYTKKVSTCF